MYTCGKDCHALLDACQVHHGLIQSTFVKTQVSIWFSWQDQSTHAVSFGVSVMQWTGGPSIFAVWPPRSVFPRNRWTRSAALPTHPNLVHQKRISIDSCRQNCSKCNSRPLLPLGAMPKTTREFRHCQHFIVCSGRHSSIGLHHWPMLVCLCSRSETRRLSTHGWAIEPPAYR